jgi:hypothetical protein
VEVEEVLVVHREGAGGKDRRDDPEAHHDLRLGPRFHLEVVVNRRHQEDAPPPELERGYLEDHRQRLDQEDPTDDEQQHLRLGEHSEAAERASDPHRSRVAEKHLRGEGVEP